MVTVLSWTSAARGDRVDDLIRILEAPSTTFKVRLLTMAYLGRLADHRAVPALTRMLHARRDSIRHMAVSTLARIGHPSALPALNELGRRRHRLGAAARRAVQLIHKRAGAEEAKKRVFVTVGRFANKARAGGPRLARILRNALVRNLDKEPKVATRWPVVTPATSVSLPGFVLDGAIVGMHLSRLDGEMRLTCQIRVSVATYPGGSMKAFYRGEASVAAPTYLHPSALYREVINGAARGAIQKIVQRYLFRSEQPAL
jgi:hypothetical protein